MRPVLYNYFRSSCSWRVRIALALKNIDYEYKSIHLVKNGGEQHLDTYKDINSISQVPTLVIDNKVFSQSIPIIEYLDELYPDTKILPSDKDIKFKSQEVANIVSTYIQPLQNLSTMQYLIKNFKISDQQKMDWSRNWIQKGFESIEVLLSKHSKKFTVSDQVTISDLLIVPQVYNAKRFNVDLTKFPLINKVTQELLQLDAFKVSHPHNQPDCPPELKGKF
ncbi:MAG: maleylacetoacetate isomerase [Bdellovibrionales bacterium]|jgi:maleylacetoacetate isomerase|nr:maleylacetoacetate isomerase [Bdellovibrionales bacterium]